MRVLTVRAALLGTAAVAALFTTPANAQPNPGPVGAQTPNNAKTQTQAATASDQGIVVTARRRNELLLNVPIAVTAYSGEQQRRLDSQTSGLLVSITSGGGPRTAAAGDAMRRLMEGRATCCRTQTSPRREGVEGAAFVEVDQGQPLACRPGEPDQRAQQRRAETRVLQRGVHRVQIGDQA